MSHLDIPLFLWINATSSSPAWLLGLARFASQELVQWLLAGAVGALVVGDAQVRRCVLQIALAMAIAWIGARLIQHLLPMPRPFALGLGTPWLSHADSASFPSTHASVAFAFAAVVAANTQRRLLGVCAFALAGMIGWSRISLGLHFPSDIVAGALVGLASSWLARRFPRRTPALSAT